MMRLQEIFDQLSAGEFSQISIAGQLPGVINEANRERVVGHINLALTAIYTRFRLKERSLEIPLQANQETYQLNAEDILKVDELWSDSGEEIPINKPGNPYSCITRSLTTLWVPAGLLVPDSSTPEGMKTSSIKAVYRANHPRIVIRFGILNPATKVIELPHSHLTALLYYVASRVNNPIGMTNEFHAGNSWYAKYEAECQRLEAEGIEIEADTTNSRLRRAGFP